MSPRIVLHPRALSDLGPLDYGFAQGSLPESKHPLLVVRLAGAGSNRAEEAGVYDHAAAVIAAGLVAWEPWAIALDLTAFDYTWGDGMSKLLVAPQNWYQPVHPARAMFGGGGAGVPEDFPVGVVTSSRNREGLESLTREYLHMQIPMFDSFDEVVRALDARLKGVLGA